jgi:thymidylate synthase (FAD)
MQVSLIDVAGGDLSVVNSARVSFNKEIAEVEPKDEKLIHYLAEHKHMTPFRHNFIQLRCEVPLFLARQLMKHQAGLTWNEESRRYVDYMPDFYSPFPWRKRPDKSIKQGSGDQMSPEDNLRAESLFTDLMTQARQTYTGLLKLGVAPEMARMVLPQNMMVNFIWSGNLLAFFHVYSLRSGEGAQEEAKVFAEELKKAVEPEFPISWKALENTL